MNKDTQDSKILWKLILLSSWGEWEVVKGSKLSPSLYCLKPSAPKFTAMPFILKLVSGPNYDYRF